MRIDDFNPHEYELTIIEIVEDTDEFYKRQKGYDIHYYSKYFDDDYKTLGFFWRFAVREQYYYSLFPEKLEYEIDYNYFKKTIQIPEKLLNFERDFLERRKKGLIKYFRNDFSEKDSIDAFKKKPRHQIEHINQNIDQLKDGFYRYRFKKRLHVSPYDLKSYVHERILRKLHTDLDSFIERRFHDYDLDFECFGFFKNGLRDGLHFYIDDFLQEQWEERGFSPISHKGCQDLGGHGLVGCLIVDEFLEKGSIINRYHLTSIPSGFFRGSSEKFCVSIENLKLYCNLQKISSLKRYNV